MDRSRFGRLTRWVITPLASAESVRSAENLAAVEVEEDEADHGSHVAVTRRASHKRPSEIDGNTDNVGSGGHRKTSSMQTSTRWMASGAHPLACTGGTVGALMGHAE
jgi:hypothetical protein